MYLRAADQRRAATCLRAVLPHALGHTVRCAAPTWRPPNRQTKRVGTKNDISGCAALQAPPHRDEWGKRCANLSSLQAARRAAPPPPAHCCAAAMLLQVHVQPLPPACSCPLCHIGRSTC